MESDITTFKSLIHLIETLQTENDCREFLEKLRWKNEPIRILKEYYNKGPMMHHEKYIQGELIQVSDTSI